MKNNDFQPHRKRPETDLNLILNSLCSLGGAVGGCRVLGAGRPGEDGPGAAAHCKNADWEKCWLELRSDV